MTAKADVVIPIYRDLGVTRDCIDSVLTRSGPALGRVILIDDCSPEPEMAPMLQALAAGRPEIVLLRNEHNLGFVGSCNRGLGLRTRDVVLLNSDTLVTEGWLAELLAVAATHDRAACVVPLSNNATICSVFRFGAETRFEEIKDLPLSVETLEPRATELPTGVGFCMLMRHSVLNMIGGLDPVFGRGYNEENDWVMRAQRLGFTAVRANRALVYHLGSVSFGSARNDLEERNAAILRARHPHYLPQVQHYCETPAIRATAHTLRKRAERLRVALDVRHVDLHRFGPDALPANGTSVYAMEIVRRIRAENGTDVCVLVASEEQRQAFERLDIPAVTMEQLGPVQVLHRPAQVFTPLELKVLLDTPSHLVITYQDLIAYRMPALFGSLEDYIRYRATSLASIHSAQAVVAISEHNRREIIEEFHVAPERVHTIHHGIDTDYFGRRDPVDNREQLGKLGLHKRFVLYAGTDYPHKNIKLLLASYGALRARLGENDLTPELVLVGPSSGAESVYRPLTEHAPPGVRYLGVVSSAALRALYQEAAVFVFPSAYEGFGLPLLEAMAAGTPVVSSNLTSLPEVGGDACRYIKDFSVDEIAGLLLEVLSSPEMRTRLIEAGRNRARSFSWRETARRTLEVYEHVVDHPPAVTLAERRAFSVLIGAQGMAERHAAHLQSELDRLRR